MIRATLTFTADGQVQTQEVAYTNGTKLELALAFLRARHPDLEVAYEGDVVAGDTRTPDAPDGFAAPALPPPVDPSAED